MSFNSKIQFSYFPFVQFLEYRVIFNTAAHSFWLQFKCLVVQHMTRIKAIIRMYYVLLCFVARIKKIFSFLSDVRGALSMQIEIFYKNLESYCLFTFININYLLDFNMVGFCKINILVQR